MFDPHTSEDFKPLWMEPADGSDSEDWRDVVSKKLGWVPVSRPVRPSSLDISYPCSREERLAANAIFYNTAEFKDYTANRDRQKRIIEDLNVDFAEYGYRDEPAYCVRIRESVQETPDWGCVQLNALNARPEWNTQMRDFVALLDLRVPVIGTPGWHVCCSYG
jgi:hypothetical protein